MSYKQDIAEIKGHIAVLNDETGNLKTDVAVIKNDIRWIKTWGIGILAIIQIVVGVVIKLL